MRIISKFKDYYDTAISFGQDLSKIYKRETIIHDKIPNELQFLKTYYSQEHYNVGFLYWKFNNFFLRSFTLIFCGKIYKGVRVTQFSRVKGIDGEQSPYEVFNEVQNCYYNVDDIAELMLKYKQTNFLKNERYHNFSNYDEIKKYFNNAIDSSKQDFFIERKLPLLVIDDLTFYNGVSKYVMIENPILSDYNFYKVMDACTTYQELDMFISGMMAAENKPMTVISDGQKVYQHGFDCRSFKKDASKHKPKICRIPK